MYSIVAEKLQNIHILYQFEIEDEYHFLFELCFSKSSLSPTYFPSVTEATVK